MIWQCRTVQCAGAAYLYGDGVGAVHDVGVGDDERDVVVEHRGGVCVGQSGGRKRDGCSGRQVVPQHFHAVGVHDAAIVADDPARAEVPAGTEGKDMKPSANHRRLVDNPSARGNVRLLRRPGERVLPPKVRCRELGGRQRAVGDGGVDRAGTIACTNGKCRDETDKGKASVHWPPTPRANGDTPRCRSSALF